jgi:hypothetical protein
MEHLEDKEISDAELFAHAWCSHSPGIVVNEEEALTTPCIGYKVDGKEMLVFSPGIIGNLDKEQRMKYCKLGITWKESPNVVKRWEKFREAIAAAKERYKDGDILKWLTLVAEELRKKGIPPIGKKHLA